MTRDVVLAACAALPGATEDFPFGDGVTVFRVGGRMFALVPLEGPACVNLKCEPELARQLREQYPAVRPGYHQDKRHWNTVDLDGTVGDADLHWMIEHSYELVVAKLTRAVRASLPSREP